MLLGCFQYSAVVATQRMIFVHLMEAVLKFVMRNVEYIVPRSVPHIVLLTVALNGVVER